MTRIIISFIFDLTGVLLQIRAYHLSWIRIGPKYNCLPPHRRRNINKPDPTGDGILNREGADLTLDLVVANFERTLYSSSLGLVDPTMECPM